MTFADLGAGETIFLDANLFVYHFVADPLYGVACSQRYSSTENRCSFWAAMPFPDYLSAQWPVPTPWTQLDPVALSTPSSRTRVNSNDLVGAAWSNSGRLVENVSRRARSVDVFQQGRFLFPCQPLTSPLPKSQFHLTRSRLFFKDRLQ